MAGIYLTQMVDVLRAAGCQVAESSITNGWQSRARSSGGFPFMPLGIQWHHTASKTAPANDLSWQIDGCDDAPVGNMLLDRTGCYWPVAAGAANTAGKGGPLSLSRGTVPKDSANSQTFAIEAANDGVGESWPQVQIDAYYLGSNALNSWFGNRPDDVFSHALGEGNGWTDRKIDPAKAQSVQGPWKPRSINSSGTWSLTDIRNECNRRSGSQPKPPVPLPPSGKGNMLLGIYQSNGPALYVCYDSGNKYLITDDGMWTGAIQLCQSNNIPADPYPVEPGFFAAMGTVVGPRPDGTDEWGNYT